MILQALVTYYESLLQEEKLPRPGWTLAKVSFALHIDVDGNLLQILPLTKRAMHGKKEVEVPQTMTVPVHVKRTVGIAAQFLCDNSSYFLGIDNKENPERTGKCFAAAAELHKALLVNCTSDAGKAVRNYFDTWNIETARKHPVVKPYLEDIENGNFVFFVQNEYAHTDSEVVTTWDKAQQKDSNEPIMQCLVTGEKAPVARLHPSIKGVKGAQASGASLVSFNASAYESYGKDKGQGLNAPVAEYAAFAYGMALNYLLADTNHTKVIGDTTVVYWAEKSSERYQDVFSGMFFHDSAFMDDNTLDSFFKAIQAGEPIEYKGMPLEYDNPFYVLGLAPNAARLSVRFFLRSTFGEFLQNIVQHMKRLEIVQPSFEQWLHIPLWAILQETVQKNARIKMASPLMAGATLQSILGNVNYPSSLFQNIMLRIRAEQGGNKVNYRRAAMLKAYLTKNKGRKITVGLNNESDDIEYVLGRMFSVLEQIQQTANPGINTTIKDRYFDSACATPAFVFPVLLKLANHHLRKLEPRKKIYLDKQLTALMGKIEIGSRLLPKYLSLDQQGMFILGYYHQTQKRYEKKGEK